jgi:two-component sensor histidine kinase
VALALLANEAITNAYKHAFVDESAGMITVALHRTDENALSLRVEDTGSGFASPNDSAGMGLTLIRTFATQLRGALVVRPGDLDSGTQITLTIPTAGTPRAPE